MAGFQNNSLTKFPLNASTKGSANTSPPGTHGPVVHTPIGPTPGRSTTHTQLTPLPAKSVAVNVKTPYHK